ncbi:hypothetical protein GCM10009738_40300 [Kitasatospora viridis]
MWLTARWLTCRKRTGAGPGRAGAAPGPDGGRFRTRHQVSGVLRGYGVTGLRGYWATVAGSGTGAATARRALRARR